MNNIFYHFDDTRQAFINPSDFVKADPQFPELCISTFSESIIRSYALREDVRQIYTLQTANGPIPVYEITYREHRVAFYMSPVGAPACVSCIEEIAARGARKFTLFGSCGVLDDAAVGNKIIVPVSAFRDEGTSYFYQAASEEIAMTETAVTTLSDCLERLEIPYLTGKTWTTDAIYRETPKLIADRKARGCIAVEMECAAALAVTRFRNIPFIQFLYGADSLAGSEWEIRDLLDLGLTHSDKYMTIALECVISMKL